MLKAIGGGLEERAASKGLMRSLPSAGRPGGELVDGGGWPELNHGGLGALEDGGVERGDGCSATLWLAVDWR